MAFSAIGLWWAGAENTTEATNDPWQVAALGVNHGRSLIWSLKEPHMIFVCKILDTAVTKPGPKNKTIDIPFCRLLIDTFRTLKKTRPDTTGCPKNCPKMQNPSKTGPITVPSRPTREPTTSSLGSAPRRGHRATTAASGRSTQPSTRQMMETWCWAKTIREDFFLPFFQHYVSHEWLRISWDIYWDLFVFFHTHVLL